MVRVLAPDPLQPRREEMLQSDDPYVRVLGQIADGHGLEYALLVEDLTKAEWRRWAAGKEGQIENAEMLKLAKVDHVLHVLAFSEYTGKQTVQAAAQIASGLTRASNKMRRAVMGRPKKDRPKKAEAERIDLDHLPEQELRKIAGYEHDSPKSADRDPTGA